MKNMKKLIFKGLVLFLLGAGGLLLMNKDADTPYEVPYLSSASLTGISLGNGIPTSKDEILPVKEWEGILTNGEWKYTTVFYGLEDIYRFEGEIEFRPDGSFERYVTVRYYFGTPKNVLEKDSYLRSVSGGIVSGKWKMADNGEAIWYEKIKKCSGELSYVDPKISIAKNLCDVFELDGIHTYGTRKEELAKYEVKTFKPDHIVIEGKRYSDDGRLVWILYKDSDAE